MSGQAVGGQIGCGECWRKSTVAIFRCDEHDPRTALERLRKAAEALLEATQAFLTDKSPEAEERCFATTIALSREARGAEPCGCARTLCVAHAQGFNELQEAASTRSDVPSPPIGKDSK